MIIDQTKLQIVDTRHFKNGRFQCSPLEDSITEVADAPAPSYWKQILLNSIPLWIADCFALACSFALACGTVVWFFGTSAIPSGWIILFTALAVPAVLSLFGLYPGTGLHAVAEMGQVVFASLTLFSGLLIASLARQADLATTVFLLMSGIGFAAITPPCRAMSRRVVSRRSWWGQPVLIFGGGETALQLYRHYMSHRHLGIRPVAIVDDWLSDEEEQEDANSNPSSQPMEELREQNGVYWAVVSTPLSTQTAAAVRRYCAVFPHVLIIPTSEKLPSIHHEKVDCGNYHGILMTNTLLLPLPRLVKSMMDRALVLAGGVVCLPLVAVIALLIKLTSPGPVFYAQQRIGKNGQPFWAWKFRTMVADADQVLQTYLDGNPEMRAEWERDHKLKNDPRISSVGYWLRKTSLDELPQLWNVMRGEMSLVGPRPIVAAEICKYGDWFELYQRTTPGITGMWQISGRNNTTYDVRVAHDSYYVLNWSPWLDLYILARTIKVVLRCEGAY